MHRTRHCRFNNKRRDLFQERLRSNLQQLKMDNNHSSLIWTPCYQYTLVTKSLDITSLERDDHHPIAGTG